MKLLPNELAQAFLNYLATRPAGEVLHLIGALQNLQDAPEPTPERRDP